MKDLQEIMQACLVLVAPAVLFAGVALPANATSFSAGAYYVGVEDHPTSGQGAGDKDYNDLVFTLSGTGLKLNSDGTLSNPITPNDNGSPFWNNLSGDGAGMNFGNCLYTPANACTGGPALDPSAKYLSSGGSFVGFDFSGASGLVTLTIDAALHTDNDTLYWCTDPSHCHAITSGGTFTPGAGTFYFELLDTTGTNHSYTSESSNFAAAVDPIQATPEPLSLALTGSGLLGLFLLRRRRTSAQ